MVENTRNETVDVGVAAVAVSKNNLGRRMLYIRNSSPAAQVITVTFSDNAIAVANKGIVLKPEEALTDSDSAGYECWKGNISAISDGANGVLTVVEKQGVG